MLLPLLLALLLLLRLLFALHLAPRRAVLRREVLDELPVEDVGLVLPRVMGCVVPRPAHKVLPPARPLPGATVLGRFAQLVSVRVRVRVRVRARVRVRVRGRVRGRGRGRVRVRGRVRGRVRVRVRVRARARVCASILACRKPSACSSISMMFSKSGTTIAHGRKSALRFSGSSVRPA